MFDAGWFDRMAGFDAGAWSAVLAAPFVGSFLGVVIRRLPEGRPIAWTRSRCEECGSTLSVRDLVPVLSWLTERGRCRLCGRWLGWFYPGVELAALGIALIAVFFDQGVEIWLDCVLGWTLLALGLDRRTALVAARPADLAAGPHWACRRADFRSRCVDRPRARGGARLSCFACCRLALPPSAWSRWLGARRRQAVGRGRGLGRRQRTATGHPDRGICRAVSRSLSAAVGRPPRAVFGIAVRTLSGIRHLARLADASALADRGG